MDEQPASASQSISSQQLPQIRTDTDTSSINNSSVDPATKSLSITATRTTVTSAARSPPHPSNGPGLPSQPMASSSPHHFAVSNTSMSFSSVDETRNSRTHSNPRPRGEANHNHNNNNNSVSSGHHNYHDGGRGLRQSPLQRRHSNDNSVMDAVSRSLNAHNDPELEGLPPMGEESSADGSTMLYAKGFLISTSPGVGKEAEAGANASTHDYLPAHLQDEEQQQQQQQQSEHSVSRSRGPTANGLGISHRLLTVEEIQERRRATSRPVSQAASHVFSSTALDANKSMNNTTGTANNNNNNRSISLSGKPAHRQMSKEETEKLIAQRQQQFREQEKQKQQQRAATAAAAAASANTSVTTASAPQRPTPPQQQQRNAPAHHHSVHAAATTKGPGGMSAPLNSDAAPWLMSGDGAQSSPLHTQSTGNANAAASVGGVGAAAGAEGVAFEWLRGASTGVGVLPDSSARSWSGTNPWRDAAVASVGGAQPSFFPGGTAAAGGAEFGGVVDGMHPVTGMGLSTGAGNGAFTWLPNTSYWPTLEQQQQQQQQQQSALIPSMASAGGMHDAFSFLSGSPALLNPSGPLASGPFGGNTVSTSTNNNGSGLQFSAPLASLTLNALQSLPTHHIEAAIRQCDEQMMRTRQDRELLWHELQRRHYAASAANINTTTNNASLGGGVAVGAMPAEAMSWPGTLGTHTPIANATTPAPGGTTTAGGTTGGAASTGSPSRFFNGTGMEGLLRMLDVPTSVLRTTAAGINFSTAASAGGSSADPTAAASDRRQSSSEGSAAAGMAAQPAAAAAMPAAAKSGGGWASGEQFNPNSNQHLTPHNNNNNNSTSGTSRGHRHGNRSHAHSAVIEKSHRGGGGAHHTISNQSNNSNHNNASTLFGNGATAAGGTRCSHDNTPQEQKYLQTDPFSMYEHNKKIATTNPSSLSKEASA